MNENEEKDVDLNNEEEVETEETQETETEETSTEEETKVEKPKESLEDRRARLQRQLEQVNKKLGIEVKKPEKKPSSTSSQNISPKDLYSLTQANVHIDDFDYVVEYAKFKKITIGEALKTDVIKTVLANKSEYRKTAEMANTSPVRKGATKLSEDKLLADLSKGQVPDKGSEEAERIFWARRGGKR